MSKLLIKPSQLNGTINAPPSKSFTHRALISASICNGKSVISNIYLSEDIKATINCLKKLGAKINFIDNKTIEIIGPINIKNKTDIILDCKESASTMRFLIPLAALFDKPIIFTGNTSLLKRNMKPILECLSKHNASFKYEKDNSFIIQGPIKSGIYKIDSSISSQFISGLLFALPILKEKSTICVKSESVSNPYIDMTIEMLKNFNIKIEQKDYKYFIINKSQKYTPSDIEIEGDFSQASFFLVAGAINSKIAIKGLNKLSKQGDKIIIEILKEVGANIFFKDNILYCSHSNLKPFEFDAKNNPDLVPILSILAHFCYKESSIKNINRLKQKESDRVYAIKSMLENIGSSVKIKDDQIKIINIHNKNNKHIDTFNDHRIAMAASIFGLFATNPITLNNYLCVNKSYPTFFKDYKSIGGKFNVINLE